MKATRTIVAHPATNDKQEALKAFMEALKIKFEIAAPGYSPYDTDFVEMVLKGDKDREKGKGKKITVEELNRLWK